jgi:benzoylformate decarboxylase
MKHLVLDLLERRLSRRHFVRALTALGVSAAGARTFAHSAQAGGAAPARSEAPVAVRKTGTGGEILVAQMKAAGVRYVFTNPGSYEVGFFDALLDDKDVVPIMGLHEGIVIALADGYHKVSGQPAFVNLHVVAGTAQAAGQMYNASRDGSALVVTAGLLDNEVFSDEALLSPRPGFNQKDINRQFTNMAWEARDARGVAMMLRRAFKLAAAPPGGPVYLALPNTVLEAEKVTADIYDRRHFMLSADIPPDSRKVAAVARMLLDARQPALILGDEVARFGAQPEVLELAERCDIPVYESPLPAFHCFPRLHPLFRGMFRSGVPDRGKGTDLALNVGDYDLGDFDATTNVQLLPSKPAYANGTKVVRIGLNTAALARNHPFTEAIVANVKLTLRALIDAVAKKRPRRKYARRKVSVEQPRLGQAPLHPDELGAVLEEVLDADAILVSENMSGANHFFNTGFGKDEKMWVSNSGAGLGWGVGAATGAKLAAPGRQVVCNIGDGSVMYSAAGFWTQARYRVPVLTVVCNNRNYQTVRNAYYRYEKGNMRREGRYPLMFLGDPDIDFVKLAGSQGVDGCRVERKKGARVKGSADLREALRRGIEATRGGKPFVVEVVVQALKKQPKDQPEWHAPFSLADLSKKN